MPIVRPGALLPGLLAFGALTATPASALIAAFPPINATFTGTGAVGSITGGTYDTEFTGSSAMVENLSGLTFTSDDITLDYTPTGFEMLARPANIPVNNTFTGTDILTTAGGGTLDLGLAGTYTGPTGSIFSVGGATLDFTGTATVTGGTLGLTGTSPFSASETEVAVPAAIPAGAVAPKQQPSGSAGYTATYGTLTPAALTPAVPEPSSYALLALGLLPVSLLARKRRRSA